MIKTVRFVRREPHLTPEQFRWRYLTQQGARLSKAVELTPIVRATTAFLVPEQITTYTPGNQLPMETDFDAVEQLYFPTAAALRSTAESGVLEALTAEEEGLADNGAEVDRIVMVEDVMALRPEPEDDGVQRLKMIRTVTRKAGLDIYQFRDYWMNHHRRLEMGGIRLGSRYRINVSFSLRQTIRVALPDGKLTIEDGDTAYDGFMDIYALAGTDFPAEYSTRVFPDHTRRDERNFINFDAPLYRAIMDEFVVATRSPYENPRHPEGA
jgi:hypothetical protein